MSKERKQSTFFALIQGMNVLRLSPDLRAP